MRLVASCARLTGALAVLNASGCNHPSKPNLVGDHFGRARGLLAVGDTSRAIALLDTALALDDRNASVWHLRGLVYWKMVRGARSVGYMESQASIDGLRDAERSLRWAAKLAPDSGAFALDLGRYFLFADLVTLRLQAPSQFRKAAEAAIRVDDSVTAAAALDEWGMVHWRRYEALAHRRALIDVDAVQVGTLLENANNISAFLAQHTRVLRPSPGQKDQQLALSLFERAIRFDQRGDRSWRHLFMTLAEQRDWTLLESRALEAVKLGDSPPLPWLALGLARQRLMKVADANAAFDSSVRRMSPDELGRATRLSRIVTEADSLRLRSQSTEARANLERTFWLTADPLFLTEGNEYRSEFFARYAFAELRWTSDDFDLKGADTDRGNIHIRYGPPPITASFAAQTSESMTCEPSTQYTQRTELPGMVCSEDMSTGQQLSVWYYPDLGLHFVFRTPPTYGIATFAPEYRRVVKEARTVASVSWLNLPVTKFEIDSVQVQVSRFRAPGDSSDVLIVADYDLPHLCAGQNSATELRQGFLAQRPEGSVVYADTNSTSLNCAQQQPIGHRAWRFRASHGPLVYRAEALSEQRSRAARSLGETQLNAGIGFDLSDILVADRIVPKPGRRIASWTDFDISPAAVVFSRDRPFGLLWETYWLTTRDNAVHYQVTVGLKNRDPATGGALTARIVRGLQRAVGLVSTGENEVHLTYQREEPASETAVDFLMLELGTTRAGDYTISVRIDDLNSKTFRSRTREISLR